MGAGQHRRRSLYLHMREAESPRANRYGIRFLSVDRCGGALVRALKKLFPKMYRQGGPDFFERLRNGRLAGFYRRHLKHHRRLHLGVKVFVKAGHTLYRYALAVGRNMIEWIPGVRRHGAENIVGRLRATRLASFYRRRLKRYPVMRLPVQWSVRFYYTVHRKAYEYRRLIIDRVPRAPLIPLAVYVESMNRARTVMVPRQIVATPVPVVVPADDRQHFHQFHLQYEFGEIFQTDVERALVTGGSNLIVTEEAVVHHDLYDFRRHFTSEELHRRARVQSLRANIAWLSRVTASGEFPRAASFTDACSGNYAHWLTEVLPRINLFCRHGDAAGVPLIIDDGLHRNLMESLAAVAGDGASVVRLARDAVASVDSLSVVSTTGYVPFGPRRSGRNTGSNGHLSATALQDMVSTLRGVAGSGPADWPKKILLQRNSGARQLTNSPEIADALVAEGFSVIVPEKLTFAEQVQLFSGAEIVVGATGAAMANPLFCRPSARIVVMMAKHRDMPYGYWHNMAAAVGNRVTYVLGDMMPGNALGIHGDYRVRRSDVLDAIAVGRH